jgi:hypothetical protein
MLLEGRQCFVLLEPRFWTTSVGQPSLHASFLLTLYMCINTIPVERR